VERLAPTGEGIARDGGKVLFLDGALADEEVEFEIFEERARFARGIVRKVLRASPHRIATGEHAAVCGGTDWAHFAPEAARQARRSLFCETLQRLGGVAPAALGELPISSSPAEYRLRNQFHLTRSQGRLRWGFFERRSRRVVELADCAVVSAPTRAKIGEIAEAAGRDLPEGGMATLETVETIETDAGHRVESRRGSRVEIRLPRASLVLSAGAFFQVNRFRVAPLWEEVQLRASEAGGKTALDAFAGGGFFSHALLAAGYRVTAVERDPLACADAAENRFRSGADSRLTTVEASVGDFLQSSPAPFDLVFADPPRGGLKGTALRLAERTRQFFFYVSCEPATLARDLRLLTGQGFRIDHAALEDFFPLTHRVEAFVVLSRRS
jgi:23S rRNA (uracil1939-C5)-methyltransferase